MSNAKQRSLFTNDFHDLGVEEGLKILQRKKGNAKFPLQNFSGSLCEKYKLDKISTTSSAFREKNDLKKL